MINMLYGMGFQNIRTAYEVTVTIIHFHTQLKHAHCTTIHYRLIYTTYKLFYLSVPLYYFLTLW